jgi:hypothetical protein
VPSIGTATTVVGENLYHEEYTPRRYGSNARDVVPVVVPYQRRTGWGGGGGGRRRRVDGFGSAAVAWRRGIGG